MGDSSMKRFLALALVLASVSASASRAAQPINLRVSTANDLAELCGANPKEPAADAKINFCHGFAQGAIDVELRAGDKKPFCFPSPTPSRGATMMEFVNWVRALPDHRSMNALDGLFRFLGERFPCK
jgi:hypothetical protein